MRKVVPSPTSVTSVLLRKCSLNQPSNLLTQVLKIQQRHMMEIQAKEVLRVEKLCAIVGFSTEQTRTLIADREITYDGTLYSEEHEQSFTARNVTAKIRQESVSKRLVLYLNQMPVSQWFKEQFERLRQSIRQPI